jgi:glycosyltransferase involved in cell wall biosynthesis
MNVNIPRILIISETFKSNSGGGITLSNLFKGYPKNCLSNAIDATEINNIHSDSICDNFYCLGLEEKKVLKLFLFLQKKYSSGRYIFKKKESSQSKAKEKSYRKTIVNYFFLILHFVGIYHLLYRYEISEKLKEWILEFKPDFIYTQLSNRELIDFTEKLSRLTGASLAIHIMDDWPSTISRKGILKKYWTRKIDCEFRNLLDKASVLMSISEGMSIAYKERYNKDFTPYHNPIEINQWTPFSKAEYTYDPENISILYAGRIGLGTSDSIIEIAKVIEQLCLEGYKISFLIQTTTSNSPIISKLKKFSSVKINKEVQYSELPGIFSKADLLVMPIDFSKKGIQFLKYSMPTKASEYMISGTPILLYADKTISLVDHAKKYGWAYCVTSNSIETLKKSIINLLKDEELRRTLAKTAYNHALENYNAVHVRKLFQTEFSQ